MQRLMVEVAYAACSHCHAECSGSGARWWTVPDPATLEGWDPFALGQTPVRSPLAALGLLESVPLWPFVALAITLDDGGPVFYGQRRVRTREDTNSRGGSFSRWSPTRISTSSVCGY